ncbi:SET domain-containing protein [Cystobasidium minutum MCA 4210]|uniref:SET domain-containing protein n=1 Tax=Cystobasidium minutum MCA 4210 TaxID=1397322 RepID=UPI0034CD85CA|eukprot:jgi/Rhomi1/103990/CE103989_346
MSDDELEEADDRARLPNSRLETLKTWLSANDVQLSPKLAIRAVPSDVDEEVAREKQDASYGIYALQSIEEDEILSVTPRKAIISKRTCALARNPAFHDFCDKVNIATPLQAGVRILAAVLMSEMQLGRQSRWFGYIQSMPQSYREVGLPIFWDSEEALYWLQGTDVVDYMEQQRCTNEDVETFFNDLVMPLLSNGNSVHVDYTTFKLAFSLVLSRAFYVDNFHGLSMVPLADVFNHHYLPHATLQSDDIVCPTCGSRSECEHDHAPAKPSGSAMIEMGPSMSGLVQSTASIQLGDADPSEVDAVEMVATTSIEAEEEVFNTYGKLDNAALLVNYGFMLEANEDDKVRWFSVKSVLKQAELIAAVTAETNKIESAWRTYIKSGEVDRWIEPNSRVSAEVIRSAHLQAPQTLLYVDADGNVSRYLCLLLSISLQWSRLEKQGVEAVPAEYIQKVLQVRLKRLSAPERDIDRLFDMLAQDKNERAVELALSRAIEERLLLTACLAQWQQQDDDSSDAS